MIVRSSRDPLRLKIEGIHDDDRRTTGQLEKRSEEVFERARCCWLPEVVDTQLEEDEVLVVGQVGGKARRMKVAAYSRHSAYGEAVISI